MPPTILPSTKIGTPPSMKLTFGTVKYLRPAPPLAITSSRALVGRRNSTAARALPSAMRIEASWVPSRRCNITGLPPLSVIEMATYQLFSMTFASATAMLFGLIERDRSAIVADSFVNRHHSLPFVGALQHAINVSEPLRQSDFAERALWNMSRSSHPSGFAPENLITLAHFS